MNSKRANWLFLAIILFHFAVVYGLDFLPGMKENIAANLVYSELILLIPAILFLMTSEGSLKEKLGIHKMRPATFGMVVLFTFLTMPLTTLVNAISMLFVDNVVVEISRDVVDMPFLLMLFLMAVYGPVCEELTFRGLIYNGYKKQGNLAVAVLLSALTFGLMHMNFNQIPYAFVIGILLALLVEASGSLWSSVLYHFIFNAQTVFLLYFNQEIIAEGAVESAAVSASGDTMFYMIATYAVGASLATPAALAVLWWIAGHEGRTRELLSVRPVRGMKGERMVTLPLLFAAAVCLAYSLLLAFY